MNHYIYVETLLNFDFHFRLGVDICELTRHVDVNIHGDMRDELDRSHGSVVCLDLNLVTPPQGGLKHLGCRDVLDECLIVLQLVPSGKLYVDVTNHLNKYQEIILQILQIKPIIFVKCLPFSTLKVAFL